MTRRQLFCTAPKLIISTNRSSNLWAHGDVSGHPLLHLLCCARPRFHGHAELYCHDPMRCFVCWHRQSSDGSFSAAVCIYLFEIYEIDLCTAANSKYLYVLHTFSDTGICQWVSRFRSWTSSTSSSRFRSSPPLHQMRGFSSSILHSDPISWNLLSLPRRKVWGEKVGSGQRRLAIPSPGLEYFPFMPTASFIWWMFCTLAISSNYFVGSWL